MTTSRHDDALGGTRPPAERGRGVRRSAVLVVVVLAVLLGGVLALSAGADPATAGRSAQPSSTAAPVPTNQLPVPTPDVPTPPTGCVPGQIGCASPSTTPTTTPCVGEDCIPQPTTPGRDPGPPGQEGDEQVGDPDCGLTDIQGCVAAGINGMFRGLVEAALSPILELLAATALSTPTIDQIPGLGHLWHQSFEIVVAGYGLLVLIGGIVVMSHESLQTRYSLKEIGPRLPVAFLAATLSLFAVDKFIRLANALSTAILGDGVDPPSLGNTLNGAMTGALTGGLFLILTALVLVVIGIGLLIVYVVRVVITLVLIVSGPLFLMFHALPHTDGMARWWWKAIGAVLAIQVVQALVLIIAVRSLLSGGMYLFTSFGAFGMLIGSIGLFVVVFKIPFWLLAVVRAGSGRSLVGGLAKAYIAAKTFGMIGSRASAASRAGTAHTPSRTSSSPAGPQVVRPVARPASSAPSGATVVRRLRSQYDAERVQATRRTRVRSLSPAFLQPGTQATTHDPALDMTSVSPAAAPAFSARPQRHTAPPVDPARRAHRPEFRSSPQPKPARPIRAAATPTALRFRSARPTPQHASTPVTAQAPPAPPTFQQSNPPPRVGDARRRTPSVPPPLFRPPAPRTRGGGDTP